MPTLLSYTDAIKTSCKLQVNVERKRIMNSENSVKKIDSSITDPNVRIGVVVLCLSPFIAPIIYKVIDKIASFAHDAMEHGYEIRVKAGPVDIALTKNNIG